MDHRTKFFRARYYYRKSGSLDYAYVKELVPEKVADKLSSSEISLIMLALEKAYCDGRDSSLSHSSS